jgi:hypothetical protein
MVADYFNLWKNIMLFLLYIVNVTLITCIIFTYIIIIIAYWIVVSIIPTDFYLIFKIINIVRLIFKNPTINDIICDMIKLDENVDNLTSHQYLQECNRLKKLYDSFNKIH